jgi:hypothetical protein
MKLAIYWVESEPSQVCSINPLSSELTTRRAAHVGYDVNPIWKQTFTFELRCMPKGINLEVLVGQQPEVTSLPLVRQESYP